MLQLCHDVSDSNGDPGGRRRKGGGHPPARVFPPPTAGNAGLGDWPACARNDVRNDGCTSSATVSSSMRSLELIPTRPSDRAARNRSMSPVARFTTTTSRVAFAAPAAGTPTRPAIATSAPRRCRTLKREAGFSASAGVSSSPSRVRLCWGGITLGKSRWSSLDRYEAVAFSVSARPAAAPSSTSFASSSTRKGKTAIEASVSTRGSRSSSSKENVARRSALRKTSAFHQSGHRFCLLSFRKGKREPGRPDLFRSIEWMRVG